MQRRIHNCQMRTAQKRAYTPGPVSLSTETGSENTYVFNNDDELELDRPLKVSSSGSQSATT